MNREVQSLRRGRGFRGAFTFIEILSVLVIMGIVSAVVIPQIASRGDLEAAAAARTIMSDMLYAQNRAIATQQFQYVSFDSVNQQYGLYSSMSPSTALTHPVSQTTFIQTFGDSATDSFENVTLASATFGAQTTLAFDATGIPYSYNPSTNSNTALSAAGTVMVSSGDYSATVTVEPDTGDISVQ